jgi:ankyrin repeat protein
MANNQSYLCYKSLLLMAIVLFVDFGCGLPLLDVSSNIEMNKSIESAKIATSFVYHEAALEGDLAAIKNYINNHVPGINSKDAQGATPLHIAVQQRSHEIIAELLKANIDASIQNSSGNSALHIAIAYNDIMALKLIMDQNKGLINLQNNDGQTPLHITTLNEHIETLQLLLSYFADPYLSYHPPVLTTPYALEEAGAKEHYRNVDENMPISRRNLIDPLIGVNWLFKQGHSIINKKDNQGKTVLHYACIAENAEVIQVLEKYIQDTDLHVKDRQGNTALHVACEQGNYHIVKFLLERNAKPNITNIDGRTALHIAAIGGHKDILDILLRYDAKKQLKDNFKHTALFYALKYGGQDALIPLQHAEATLSDDELEEVQTLCQKKSFYKGKKGSITHMNLDDAEKNSLDHLLKEKHTLTVDALAKSVHAAIGPDKSLLVGAAKAGSYQVIEYLIDTELAKVDATDQDEFTPLQCAAENGHLAIVQLLLQRGANPNKADDYNRTPLYFAAQEKHEAIVNELLANQALPNISNSDCETPLHVAADSGQLNIALLLLENGADPNSTNINGCSPLHLAVNKGYLEIAQALLGKGANPNITMGEYAFTPLYYAIKSNNLDMVKLLLVKGADPYKVVRETPSRILTALQIAQRWKVQIALGESLKFQQIIDLLTNTMLPKQKQSPTHKSTLPKMPR